MPKTNSIISSHFSSSIKSANDSYVNVSASQSQENLTALPSTSSQPYSQNTSSKPYFGIKFFSNSMNKLTHNYAKIKNSETREEKAIRKVAGKLAELPSHKDKNCSDIIQKNFTTEQIQLIYRATSNKGYRLNFENVCRVFEGEQKDQKFCRNIIRKFLSKYNAILKEETKSQLKSFMENDLTADTTLNKLDSIYITLHNQRIHELNELGFGTRVKV